MNGKAKTIVASHNVNHTSKLSRSKSLEKLDSTHPCGGGIGHHFQLLMEPFAKFSSLNGARDHARLYAIFVCVKCGAGLEVCINQIIQPDEVK